MTEAPAPLWSGRFSRPPSPAMLRLTSSIAVDLRLLPWDALATKAHARTLVVAGLIESGDLARLDHALDELVGKYEAGELVPEPADEDVHSFVERELVRRLGEVGARIHAGRSRNDLVATDLRLYCRDAATRLGDRVVTLGDTLAARAEEQRATVMPGYTHLQRAQPVTLGFHLLAHGFALARDGARFERARESADVSALGAGAIAGNTLGLDASRAAAEMGFPEVFANAADVVSDRDFAADLLYACAMCGTHLSRLAEEVVLWTTSEFGFALLPDEWTTGSSMMPQKRNPDLAELIRGRGGRAPADLGALLGVLKGLPLAYDRDLQEDKEIVFGAVDRCDGMLEGMAHLVTAMEFDAAAMAAATATGGLWATDVAEALVRRGIAFRDAHAATGRLVAVLEARGAGLEDATNEELRAAHPALEHADRRLADARRSVEARSATAPAEVDRQLVELRRRLRGLETRRGPAAAP